MIVLLVLVVFWFWLLHTESGAAWAFGRVESAMGGGLSGEFASGDFAAGIEIKNLHLSTDAIDVSTRSVQVSINVDLIPLRVEVSGAHLRGVAVEPKASATKNEQALDIESLLNGLRLPLRIDLLDARVDEIDLMIGEGEPLSVERIDTSIFWHNEISIRQFQVRNGDDAISVLGDIKLVSPQSVDLAVNATYQSIAAQGNISGDGRSVELRKLIVAGDDIQASGSATVRLIDEISGSASLNVDRFNPGMLTEVWPDGHPVTGALNVEASLSAVKLLNSTLAITNTDTTLEFDAILDRESSTVSGNISWLNIQWPIDSSSPNVRSADGQVSVDGMLGDWKVRGLVAVGTEDMPDGRFKIDGGGDQDRVVLSIDDGKVFGGSVDGEVAYSWRDDQPWSASVEFDDLRTNDVAPEWPGEISGHAKLSGTQRPFAVDATMRDVAGVIRGEALTASGSVAWSNAVAFADNLSITHGGTEILLDGSADTADGLRFRGVVDIESYVDGVSGKIVGTGRLSRVGDNPYLSLDMNSEQLIIGDVHVAGIQLVDERAEDAVAGFVLHVDQLQAAGQNVVDIELLASIKKDRQVFHLTGTNRGSEIGITLDGALDDWQLLSDSPWHGNVSSFSVDLEDEHKLHLENPAAVELSSDRISIKEFCLADEVSSHMCVDVLRSADGQLDLGAELSNVPIALIEHIADTGLSFDQHISGSLKWLGDADRGATGHGALELSAGVISSREQSSLAVPTGTGQVAFEIINGDLLSGTASIPMPGIGGVDADFKVLELTAAATSGISGHLNIEMTDIALLAHFSKLIDSADGGLRADLELSGTVSNPLLTGAVVVEDGGLNYRPIGLQLDHIKLVGNLTENRAIELSGSFRAGEGYGEIVSSADYRNVEQPGIRFKIRGEELQVVNVPDIRLIAKPDFEIAYRRGSMNINGSILIPTARISPSNLAENRIDESDDVVIVAGRLPDTPDEPDVESKLTFDGQLKIDLGSDVVVDLDIAKANLSGSAVFDWQGDALPIVDGRYDLAGDIQAFGQVLDIAEGGIRFTNVPANEPYLRIRAEREIYGNSQVKRAGVLVDGMASHPTIEAYTYPLTTEERALTLLVTGSDFDYEQGVGAVDFGTYIAPRLFVSYGVGIFDRENIISARYDLAKGFGVKATSGSQESGVDLNYRFEN